MTVIRHVIISGRVQGVGHRDWTARTAARLGVEGWVRNRSDGTVEAVFAGGEASVTVMIDGCRQGPRWAVVTAIEERDASEAELALARLGEFVILTTA